MITATNEGGGFLPLEAGTYVARCVKMVHIGTILEEFQEQKKLQDKVWICWEFPTETNEFKEGKGQEPYVLSKEFTLSLHEKSNLRKFLESWRGKKFSDEEAKSFDVSKLLGVPCMATVNHKVVASGKTYAEVSGVGPVMKGLTVPPQFNETFELNYENFIMEAFMTLPEFIRKKMETSNEFKRIENNEQMHDLEMRSNADINQSENNDLPF